MAYSAKTLLKSRCISAAMGTRIQPNSAMTETTSILMHALTAVMLASCGDGIVQTGVEACDDGNNIDTDACTNSCEAATCGDGITTNRG